MNERTSILSPAKLDAITNPSNFKGSVANPDHFLHWLFLLKTTLSRTIVPMKLIIDV